MPKIGLNLNKPIKTIYNKHLENTLKAMQEFKAYFSVDQFEGINLHGDDEWLDFCLQIILNFIIVYAGIKVNIFYIDIIKKMI